MRGPKNGQILVLLATGFEECGVVVITKALRQAGLPVALVGLSAGPVRGCYGISITPDKTLSEVEPERVLAIVLPAGIQGARHLNADPRVHRLLRETADRGGYVLALDTGYVVLRTAGTVGQIDRKAESSWQDNLFSSEEVKVEGQVIFSHSGAALKSAFTLVALLENRRAGRE